MTHVVVIGGGVIGMTTAYALQKRGCSVTVLDSATPGKAASDVNAGWVCPSLSDPVPSPGLVRTSLKWMLKSDSPLYIRPTANPQMLRWLVGFWRHCNANDYRAGLEATSELNKRTFAQYDELSVDGVQFEQHRDGILFAYIDPRHLEADLKGLEPLANFGVKVPKPLWGDAVHELEPALADVITGGYWMEEERHVRPDSLMSGLVEWLSERMVDIRPDTPVLGITHHNGRVTAVKVPGGAIECDHAVIASGAWSGEVAKLAGAKVPMTGGKGYCIDFTPPPHPVRHALYLHEARVAVTPMEGMVRLGGTMELSGINSRIRPERVRAITRTGGACLRDWPTEPGHHRVGYGHRPLTPDGLPVIGMLPGFTNLSISSGHAMLGVTLAPATADALSDLVMTGKRPDVLRPFDPKRFT